MNSVSVIVIQSYGNLYRHKKILQGRKRCSAPLSKTKAMSTNSKPPYTATVAHAGTLYISGQIGTDAKGLLPMGFAAEVHQVMQNLGALLQAGGLGYNDLVQVTIYLTSMDNYAVTNEVYTSYFTGRFPARVCIAVKELPRQANIEIAGTAALK